MGARPTGRRLLVPARRMFVVISAIVLIIAACGGGGGASATAGDMLARIKKDGVIRVGTDPNYAPLHNTALARRAPSPPLRNRLPPSLPPPPLSIQSAMT